MAVVMEGGSSWRKRHDAARDFVLQSSNSSNKSEDSSKPSTSSTSGASTVIALGSGGGGGGGGGQSAGQSKKRGWGDDLQKALQLMLGQVPERETLDFLGVSNVSHRGEFLELDPNLPLPVGWEKCLDLRSGAVYFLNRATGEKTLADPRQLVPGYAAAAPATPSYHDGEADRNSDSPGTPPRSAARNFFGSRSSSSPSPRERAIESSSPSRGGSGLFLGSCLSTACLAEQQQAEPAVAPMPWELEHWAAAAKGFSERKPLPAAAAAAAGAPTTASSEFRFRRLQARSPEAMAPLEDSSSEWRSQGLNCCPDDMGSNLELKLSSTCSRLDGGALVKDEGRSVCTMEKVREALLRSDKMLCKSAHAPSSSTHVAHYHQQQVAPGFWTRSSCHGQPPLLNLRSSPASPSHSSSSASSSTPPSTHDVGGEARASPPKRFRSCSPKSLVAAPPPPSQLYRVSSPNCVSSSSNVSSPAHPSSAGYAEGSPCCNLGGVSSTISPNLASLKLAELESGSPGQVLTLGSSSAEAGRGAQSGGCAVALACCKSCLMYMLLSKEDPRCPRCHNSVDVAFTPSGPCTSSLPPLKKAKVEMDL